MTGDKTLERVKDDLLDLADFAYQRLHGRVTGLTDEEYLWEPAPYCWSVRPVGDGTFRADGTDLPPEPAPLTTIAWRLSHLIGLLAAVRNATWLGVTPVGPPDRSGDPGTAAAAISQLAEAFASFRRHLQDADAAELGAPVGPVGGPYADSTRAAFVLHQLDELIHHGAEVGTMRDLYRVTRPVDPFADACRRADRSTVDSMLAADPGLRERHPALVAELAAAQHWPAVRLLVELGFDVNASTGVSALHYAAGAGELAVVRLLVSHGADRTVRDSRFNLPPVEWARYFRQRGTARYLSAE
jgi:hypothetical protein